MKKAICFSFAVVLAFGTLFGTHCYGVGLEVAAPELGGSTKTSSSDAASAAITVSEPVSPPVSYSKVTLSNKMLSFLATVDGDISVTVLSSEKDFVNGGFVEYYNSFEKADRTLYYDAINTLKTVAEANDYVHLQFLDPFLVSTQSYIRRFPSYHLKYGDIFISCYSNFDGNPQTRYSAIELADCFKTKQSDGKTYITGLCIEQTLYDVLRSLRDSRDINLAYLTDMCAADTIIGLRNYLDGKGYNIDNISITNEKLNGYDMILIAEPVRDITLEELVLLDTFLEGGGNGGRSLMYFAPKSAISMPNLHTFLLKWGIDLIDGERLYSLDDGGYFADNTRLYASSLETLWTMNSDNTDGFYIMDSCTPISINSFSKNVSVSTLFKTKARNITTIKSENTAFENNAAFGNSTVSESSTGLRTTEKSGFSSRDGAPLVTLSKKTKGKAEPSYVVTVASSDFLTTYFTLQNETSSPEGYRGNDNANLSAVNEIMERLNAGHRDEKSGLLEYAVTKSEMGIDYTSGIDTSTIMRNGIIFTAVFIALVMLTLFLMNRRRKNVKRQ